MREARNRTSCTCRSSWTLIHNLAQTERSYISMLNRYLLLEARLKKKINKVGNLSSFQNVNVITIAWILNDSQFVVLGLFIIHTIISIVRCFYQSSLIVFVSLTLATHHHFNVLALRDVPRATLYQFGQMSSASYLAKLSFLLQNCPVCGADRLKRPTSDSSWGRWQVPDRAHWTFTI